MLVILEEIEEEKREVREVADGVVATSRAFVNPYLTNRWLRAMDSAVMTVKLPIKV